MNRPVLLVCYYFIAIQPFVFSSKDFYIRANRHIDLDKSSAKYSDEYFSDNWHKGDTKYLLPVGEHRFPQLEESFPTSYGTKEVILDDPDCDRNKNQIPIPNRPPGRITNTDVILGRVLPNAGGVYESMNSIVKAKNRSPNFIRAEIPQASPKVVGTIGSGSLGYTLLGNGLLAVGSGSLGFAAHVPSQAGKGSFTVQKDKQKLTNF